MRACKRKMTWNTRVWRLALYACVLLAFWMVGTAAAEPELMTDAELDAVAARGTVDDEGNPILDLGGIFGSADPDGTGALFGFNLGSLFGSGRIDLTRPAEPSTLTLNGTLSAGVMYVDNLIFNLNICTGCSNSTVYQTGLGLPVTINPVTVNVGE